VTEPTSIINGATAKTAVTGAVGLLAVIIVSVTAIIISGKPVPDFFITIGSLLTGFLIGTRVVPPSVAKAVVRKDVESDEKKITT
jgi:uncharacterized membrane protein